MSPRSLPYPNVVPRTAPDHPLVLHPLWLWFCGAVVRIRGGLQPVRLGDGVGDVVEFPVIGVDGAKSLGEVGSPRRICAAAAARRAPRPSRHQGGDDISEFATHFGRDRPPPPLFVIDATTIPTMVPAMKIATPRLSHPFQRTFEPYPLPLFSTSGTRSDAALTVFAFLCIVSTNKIKQLMVTLVFMIVSVWPMEDATTH